MLVCLRHLSVAGRRYHIYRGVCISNHFIASSAPSLSISRALMDGNMKHGKIQEAFALRNRMLDVGVELDLHAYTCLIWGLCKQDQVQEAKNLLNEMIEKGVVPDDIVYGILLRKHDDLEMVEEAIALQNEMARRGLLGDIVDHESQKEES